jgi:hypothetical protein
VTACQITYNSGTDYNNATIPTQVAIQVTVSTQGSTVVLNGAADPRRAIKY